MSGKDGPQGNFNILTNMHKRESVLENEIRKVLWNSEIQMDHPIQARRPVSRDNFARTIISTPRPRRHTPPVNQGLNKLGHLSLQLLRHTRPPL